MYCLLRLRHLTNLVTKQYNVDAADLCDSPIGSGILFYNMTAYIMTILLLGALTVLLIKNNN